MKITIDPFDSNSITKALAQIRQYEREFKAKEQEFVRRLAEIGVSVAETGFAPADYDGENDVRVRLVKTSNGYSVEAFGESVGFIEFGTGVKYPEWDSTNMEYTPPKHGTYGKGQGANPKGWFYGHRQHTYGNQPAEAMRTARDEMVDRVIKIAREVWR